MLNAALKLVTKLKCLAGDVDLTSQSPQSVKSVERTDCAGREGCEEVKQT